MHPNKYPQLPMAHRYKLDTIFLLRHKAVQRHGWISTSNYGVPQQLSWKGQEKTIKICEFLLFAEKRKRNHGKPQRRGNEEEEMKNAIIVEIGSFVRSRNWTFPNYIINSVIWINLSSTCQPAVCIIGVLQPLPLLPCVWVPALQASQYSAALECWVRLVGKDPCEKLLKDAFLGTSFSLGMLLKLRLLAFAQAGFQVCLYEPPSHWPGPDVDCRLTSQLNHQPVWSPRAYLKRVVAERGCPQTRSALLGLMWDSTFGEDSALLPILAPLPSQSSLPLSTAKDSTYMKSGKDHKEQKPYL